MQNYPTTLITFNNMFLRWMVRKDDGGVDFGLWNTIKPAQLVCPLDVHSMRTASLLGLSLIHI